MDYGVRIAMHICHEKDLIFEKYEDTSDKSDELEGIGIASVEAVCAKHEGLMKIDINENVWKSSVLVTMKDDLPNSDELT